MLRLAVLSVLFCAVICQHYGYPPSWGSGSSWRDVSYLRGEEEVAWRAARETINDSFYGGSRYFMIPIQVLRAHKKDQVIEMEALFGESDCKMRGVPVRQIDFRNCAVRQGAERAIFRLIADDSRRWSGIEVWKIRDVYSYEGF